MAAAAVPSTRTTRSSAPLARWSAISIGPVITPSLYHLPADDPYATAISPMHRCGDRGDRSGRTTCLQARTATQAVARSIARAWVPGGHVGAWRSRIESTPEASMNTGRFLAGRVEAACWRLLEDVHDTAEDHSCFDCGSLGAGAPGVVFQWPRARCVRGHGHRHLPNRQ